MAAKICIHRFMIFLIIIAAAVAGASAGNTNANYVKVDFTKDLNVGTLTSKTYTDFLKTLRTKLAATYSGNVPVLPMYTDTNPPGFDVILTSGTNKTSARFRGDNLYVVGFQMQKDQKWYEFGKKDEKPPQLIQGAEFLGFTGDYPALEGIAGSVVKMEMNKKKLIDSVANLAWSDNKKDRAEALIVLVQMISEAARFLDISNHFASNLDKNAKLPEWMRTDLENNWASWSYILLNVDSCPTYKFPSPPPKINGKEIKNAVELRSYFGILYRGKKPLEPCSKSLFDEMKSVFEFETRHFGPRMVAQA